MTNEEKIKKMDTRKMAIWLTRNTHGGYCKFCANGGCNSKCIEGIIAWLRQEDEDDGK